MMIGPDMCGCRALLLVHVRSRLLVVWVEEYNLQPTAYSLQAKRVGTRFQTG